MEAPKPTRIIFFDGYCSLCNGLVDWLMKHDHGGILKFASLQGETAKALFPEAGNLNLDPDTAIYFREGKVYRRSAAILWMLWDLGGVWRIMGIGLLFPRFIRDSVYGLVAKNRYSIFGKRETCRIPAPEEKARLLP